MKIKDQIRARREQLDITVGQLAERLGVSDQTVRYWEAGRSRPNKHMAKPLEAALSFTIDFHEGAATPNPYTADVLNDESVAMAIKFARLPVSVRRIFSDLADAYATSKEEASNDALVTALGSVEVRPAKSSSSKKVTPHASQSQSPRRIK